MAVISQSDLINRFHKEMLNIYIEAKKINYNATGYLQMLSVENGYFVAKKLISSNQPSTGFTVLWEKKRLDLTVEALVLKEDYYPLFSKKERQIATERLIEYGHKIQEINKDNHVEELIKEDGFKIPNLDKGYSAREYNFYKEDRDSIVYNYLFNSMSYLELDEHILKIPTDLRTGYESMNILNFIGLSDIHNGIFKDCTIEQAIQRLELQEYDFFLVIQHLYLYRLNNQIDNSKKLEDILTKDIDSENAEDDIYYKDGAVKQYFGRRYERNPENRKKAIEIHGFSCVACGFNFEEIYGERGKDFIEVHHVKLLSTLEEEMFIDPKRDLVPVCSNCHRMIHRRKDNVLTIDELKELLLNVTLEVD